MVKSFGQTPTAADFCSEVMGQDLGGEENCASMMNSKESDLRSRLRLDVLHHTAFR